VMGWMMERENGQNQESRFTGIAGEAALFF
jgi:hypothetical protein